MKRYDIINWFIQEYGYKIYLEIGLDQPKNCFDLIQCEEKFSIDPKTGSGKSHFRMTSDAFFSENKMFFDIVFVDGMHLADYACNDIKNSLKSLHDNGTIIIHDCNPQNEIEASPNRTTRRWNGNVWQAFAYFRATRKDLLMYTVDADEGCGIIRNGCQDLYTGRYDNYADLAENRDEILKLISPEFMKSAFTNNHKTQRVY